MTDETTADETTETAGSAQPPRDDGLNLMGFYERPGDDGETITVQLQATDDAKAVYEAKGYVFKGYAPA